MDIVRANLPEENFDNMILMLKKFLGFMNLTVSTEHFYIFFFFLHCQCNNGVGS